MYGAAKTYETGQPMAEDQAAMPPEAAEAPPAEAAPPADDTEAQLQDIAASAPPPTKPFSVKALKTLLDTFNDTLKKISSVEMPMIELDFEGEKGKFDQPLPGDLFLPLVAISELVKMVAGGEFESKYTFDPFNMLNDTDVRKVTALLKMMAKDKKFDFKNLKRWEFDGRNMPTVEAFDLLVNDGNASNLITDVDRSLR